MTPNADIQALQQSLVEGAVTAREFDDLAEVSSMLSFA